MQAQVKTSKRVPADFESTIAGIPCGIVVTHYHNTPAHRGSPHTCDSDMDYYGYTEFEFYVVDRKGYKAAWLEKKLTDEDNARLEAEYEKAMRDN